MRLRLVTEQLLRQVHRRQTDYKDMREVKSASRVVWPDAQILENFYFECVDTDGTFIFEFKWIEGRWRCWVTTPSGEVRQIGIYPNALSGVGFLDYGFDLRTDRAEIDFDSLFETELYIVKWL